ncbi:hypothetical protein ['Camptotheca acuminata' phytoplasma]|uniref:hypothetical protein n=1 Tax='Camptotheca acuminata' phytoplasma TaxID=3239192 RepID=UPI00351A15AE
MGIWYTKFGPGIKKPIDFKTTEDAIKSIDGNIKIKEEIITEAKDIEGEWIKKRGELEFHIKQLERAKLSNQEDIDKNSLEIHKVDLEINDLMKQITNNDEELKNKKAKKDEIDKTITSKKAELELLIQRKEKASNEGDKNRLILEISDLRGEIGKLLSEKGNLEAEIKRIEDTKESLTKSIATLTRNREVLEEEAAKLDEYAREIFFKIDNATERLVKINKNIEEVQKFIKIVEEKNKP